MLAASSAEFRLIDWNPKTRVQSDASPRLTLPDP